MALDALLSAGPWAVVAWIVANPTARLIVAIVVIVRVPTDQVPPTIKALAELFRPWRRCGRDSS